VQISVQNLISGIQYGGDKRQAQPQGTNRSLGYPPINLIYKLIRQLKLIISLIAQYLTDDFIRHFIKSPAETNAYALCPPIATMLPVIHL
jgi:hypothetical protein